MYAIRSYYEAYVFGSRALGNYKPGSDIDIAIVGEHITRQDILYLMDVLNEVEPLPYFIDIVHFNSLQNHQLKEHILKKGVLLMDNDKPKD